MQFFLSLCSTTYLMSDLSSILLSIKCEWYYYLFSIIEIELKQEHISLRISTQILAIIIITAFQNFMVMVELWWEQEYKKGKRG